MRRKHTLYASYDEYNIFDFTFYGRSRGSVTHSQASYLGFLCSV